MCNIIILEEFLAAEFEAAMENQNTDIDINRIVEENKEWEITLDALFPC